MIFGLINNLTWNQLFIGRVSIYLFIFILLDKLLGKRIEGKYYLIHFICNSYIVYLTLPDVIYTYKHFTDAFWYPVNYNAAAATFALHFYHIVLYFKKLRFDDWLHHIVMVLCALPLAVMTKGGSLLGHSLFYLTGLPGGIDYLLLALVRNKIIPKITEKRINNYLNLWIRCPGCIAHSTLTIIGYNMNMQYDTSYFFLYSSMLTGLMVFWNGIYFMNQVVVNYAKNNKLEN